MEESNRYILQSSESAESSEDLMIEEEGSEYSDQTDGNYFSQAYCSARGNQN